MITCIQKRSIAFQFLVGFWLLAGPPVIQTAVADNGQAYERAREHLNRGEWEEALELINQMPALQPDFSEAIRLDPTDARAYHYRSYALRNSGKPVEAQADLKKAVEIVRLGQARSEDTRKPRQF